jgi:hypothetical protein
VASTSSPRRDVPNDKEEVAGGPEDHLKGKPGDAEVPGVPFLDCSYGSQTSPNDYDFAISLYNWDGIWKKPLDDEECVFDSHMLDQINDFLP